MTQNLFSKHGDFINISPDIIELHANISFSNNSPLVYMVKDDRFCCMTLSFDLTKKNHREIAFFSIVDHAYKNGSDSVAVAVPCFYDEKNSSLALTSSVNAKNSQGVPLFVSLSISSSMEVVEGAYFQVLKDSFDVSVFPFSRIPNETLVEIKNQLGIKNLAKDDETLAKSKVSIEDPIWSNLFDRNDTLH